MPASEEPGGADKGDEQQPPSCGRTAATIASVQAVSNSTPKETARWKVSEERRTTPPTPARFLSIAATTAKRPCERPARRC